MKIIVTKRDEASQPLPAGVCLCFAGPVTQADEVQQPQPKPPLS
jgi:hypothetical protein